MHDVIVSTIPESVPGQITQYVRDDGFTVFLDNDPELDNIRLHADPLTIIKAVAIRRCQQIANNYARKYAPNLMPAFQVKGNSLRKLLKI